MIPRRAAKVDANQSTVVRALRRIGASVQSLASVGGGCPDLLVAFRGRTVLMEVKDGSKSPSRQRLRGSQEEWIEAWRGEVHVVKTVDEALAVLGLA